MIVRNLEVERLLGMRLLKMSASISVRWRIVGDFRRDIWVRIGRRFAYDETRIVVRKTKWYHLQTRPS